MPEEVEALLRVQPGAVVFDGTLGAGGHSARLAAFAGPSGHVIATDQDPQAIAVARQQLASAPGKVDIVHSNFTRLDEVLDGLGVTGMDAALFDLGLSSIQIDGAERGFSFRTEAPLDMRMDPSTELNAADLVNTLSEEELARIIWEYGEERFSRRIARGIVLARAAAPVATTADLAGVVLKAMPARSRRDAIHPATRTFQAIRIAVNGELEAARVGIGKAFERLNPGGRLAVIAFHSLEDRIVKEMFRGYARSGRAVLLTKKPLRPSAREAAANPRSRSARLRGLERVG